MDIISSEQLEKLIIDKDYNIIHDYYINGRLKETTILYTVCKLDDVEPFLKLDSMCVNLGLNFIPSSMLIFQAFNYPSPQILDYWANLSGYTFRLNRETKVLILRFYRRSIIDYALSIDNICEDDLIDLMKSIHESKEYDDYYFEKICAYFRNKYCK